MEPLSLTLDDDTASKLAAHAKRDRRSPASLACELIREALLQRDARDRRQKLARDYAAGRADAAEVNDFGDAQID